MALTGLQGWPLVAGDAHILVLLVAVGEQVAQGLGQRLHVEVEERVAVLDGLGGLCWWSGLSALDGTLGSLGGWWRLSSAGGAPSAGGACASSAISALSQCNSLIEK